MCRRLLANPVMETASWEIARRRADRRARRHRVTLTARRPRVAVAVFPGHVERARLRARRRRRPRLGGAARLAHRDRSRARPMRSSCPADSRTATTCAPGRSRASRRSWARSRPSPHAGGPVIGSCNGFQILTEAGLLPGALMRNDHLEFRCDWQTLRVESSASCDGLAGRPRRRRGHPPADQPRRGALRRRCRHARRARDAPVASCSATPTPTGG